MKIQDPKQFGKVAVLMGGWSAEREVSLKSGKAVHQALVKRGVDAHLIDAGRDVLHPLEQGGFQRVFIALHGRGGEDGVIQGALEMLNMPYTGSGVLGSALAMDKLRTKEVWYGVGLPTPPFVRLRANSAWVDVVNHVGIPLVVKPAREGSSIGISKVDHIDDLATAWNKASALDDVVIAERWIQGGEYTASILNGQALPLIRVETPRTFYDYEAKYFSNDTRYHCPCGLSPLDEKKMQELALQAFDAVGAQGWGRVDLFRDQDGKAWLIEVNTVPGMTDHSLVPMAAKAAGISFEELVWRILETSMRG